MTDYFYDMDLVVDPLNPSNVVANGLVSIYDPADTAGVTLLALKDPSGLPLPNPLPSNANGFLPPRIATVPQTMWKSGGFTGYFNSYKGLRDESVAAVTAAQSAANDASTAAAQVVTTATVDGAGNLKLTKANGAIVDAGPVKGQKGDKGDKGDKGLDGSNVLPTDDAIKQAINDTASATRGALNATYARTGTKGVYVDVTAGPYNAKGDGTADDYAALNQAAADVEAAGGGTVFLPMGVYRISAYLRPRTNVRYQGAGMGKTIIKPYQSAAFTGHGTLAAPIQRPEWVDMTWDGSNIPASNSLKGHFSMYLKDALWLRVECKNFTATGFGSDYLPGGRYIDCVATGNGRGQAIDGPGMSGFGIGTGQYQVEDVLVQGCKATGNTNYGIFVERQPDPGAFNSLGVRVIGNYVDGNGYGIGGCGVDSSIYSDNIVANSVRDGITLHAGSGASPLGMPDKRATITGNHVYGSGRDGIHIDYEQNSIPANQARHIIAENNVHNNTRDGFRLIGAKWASDVVRGIKLALNKFTNNGGYGANVVTATGAEAGATIADLTFTDNDLNGNTLDGLHIAANLLRPVIKGNKGHDDQFTKTQPYGITTDAGYTLTDATVRANELTGNKTGACQLNASWAGDCDVRGNKGYIPGWASITVAASPFTYTCGVTPETVYWAGGSTTSVKLTPKGSSQATVLLATGTATLPVEPGDVLEFAYSAAPTSLKAMRRQ